MAFTHPNYTLIKELGRGGSATVHLAVQNNLNRRVALKVLHGAAVADAKLGKRFLREGRLVAKLNHPHIVPIFDIGEQADGDSYYLAMEYLAAGSLADQQDLTIAQALQTLKQIASALAHAHQHDIVHRDVKPDNILFRNPGEALLVDFGIARSTQSLTNMTVTGAMLGTPAYMSPEQVSGEEIGPRSDLYSLGIVTYELLSGHCPFQGDSIMSTGLQHLTTTPPPLPKSCEPFQGVVDRLLAKKPADRLATADEFITALSAAQAQWTVDENSPLSVLHEGDGPKPASLSSTLSDVQDRGPRSVWRAWAAGTLLVILVGGAAWFYSTAERNSDPIPTTETELQRLVNQAQDAYRVDNWFGDNTDSPNALVLWRQVAAQEPSHAVATESIQTIFNVTLQRATAAVDLRDFDTAERLHSQLTEYWPQDPQLLELRQRIDSGKSTVTSQQQTAARTERVASLLSQAGAAISANRWVNPPADSALKYYRDALQLDSNNALANAGLATVADYLLNAADAATAAGNFRVAEQRIGEAGKVRSNHPRLAASRKLLQDAKQQQLAVAETQRLQQELDADISAAVVRVDGWLEDEAAELGIYPTLRDELTALVARAPNRRDLKRLLSNVERQAKRLEAAAATAVTEAAARNTAKPVEEDDDEDADWTGIISF